MKNSQHGARDVSIVIPTMNRSSFVTRSLRYYAGRGFNGKIYIGDSSDTRHLEITEKEVERLHTDLDIIHTFMPQVDFPNDAAVVRALAELVDTPYVCQPGDDDFLIPKSLESCASYLDRNSDFVAVRGRRISFSLMNDQLYSGNISNTSLVLEAELEQKMARDRYIAYMRNGRSIQFYVFRSEVFSTMYRHTSDAFVRYIGDELLPCSIGVTLGKIATLDLLATVYHVHKKHHYSWYENSFYQILLERSTSETFRFYRRCIAEIIAKTDDTDIESSLDLVDRELWRQIFRMLSWQYKKKYSDENTTKIGTMRNVMAHLRKVPGIGRPISIESIYWSMREIWFSYNSTVSATKFSLKALESEESEYVNDFSHVQEHLKNWEKYYSGGQSL